MDLTLKMRRRRLLGALGSLMFLSPLAAQSPDPQIENDRYILSVNAAAGTLDLTAKAGSQKGLVGAKLPAGITSAQIKASTHPVFGSGQCIELQYADASRDVLALYPSLPFALMTRTLRNTSGETQVFKTVAGLSGQVLPGVAPLTTLGSGGLSTPQKNPGSYAFLAIAEPQSRHGLVAGWLSHERGDGVLFTSVKDGQTSLETRLDYGRLQIKPGEEAQLETLALGYFDDARAGLEAYGQAVGEFYHVKLPPKPAGFCTWYTEKYAFGCDEVHIRELTDYVAANLKPFGLDFVQIDDYWQAGEKRNGPKKNFTAHDPKGPYPGGMKATADYIRGKGLTPGIWFMPFAGTYNDPFFEPHQDWFVKTLEGKPYDTPWGGTCLDMTHPGAREHLRNVVDTIGNQWGYKLFKLDGFWTGSGTRQIYVNDGYKEDHIGDAVFADPTKSNIEALREGVKLLRRTAGPDVFLLGCCISQNMRSFGGSFGLLDAMRVGPDTGSSRIGWPHASRVWFLNGKVWWNDPDCVSVRGPNTIESARLNASFTAVADDLFYNSDWIPDLPPERLDILKRCIPAHNLPARPVDVLESSAAHVWHVSDEHVGRRDLVALYNWDQQPSAINYPLSRIGLPAAESYVAFSFWDNAFIGPMSGNLTAALPGKGSCRILSIKPVSNVPQLLSTSRHITQGMLEVKKESWNPADSTFSGTSQLVAGDPYELRFVVPVGANSWRCTKAVASETATGKTLTAQVTQQGPRLRVAMVSASGGEVQWHLEFSPAPIAASAPAPVKDLQAQCDRIRGTKLSWSPAENADYYQVERSDGVRFEAFGNLLEDPTVVNKDLRYQVRSVGWAGQMSEIQEVIAPAPKLGVCPPPPPAPNVALVSLKPSKVSATTLVKAGQPARLVPHLGGKAYPDGLTMQGAGSASFAVPPNATAFVAQVGFDDQTSSSVTGGAVFQVWGDVKEMGEKPMLLGETPLLDTQLQRRWVLQVPLDTRIKELQLVIKPEGSAATTLRTDWLEAGFLVMP